MEEQCICSPLSWAYYFQEEGLEESLFYSTLELEAAVIAAQEEISRKDDEILQLRDLLAKTIKERDDFQTKCQKHALEKQLLVQIQAHSSKQLLLESDCPISSGTTSNEDDNSYLSPSDCDDSMAMAIPVGVGKENLPSGPPATDLTGNIPIKKALPEQGKFLQAVMEAGPLLQTLLLAGPLPQWQHPPPQLNSVDIPPVTLSSPTSKLLRQDSCIISPTTASVGGFTKKRGMELASDFSPTSKYQKLCSPFLVDPTVIN